MQSAPTFTIEPTIQIDSRTDQAEVAALANAPLIAALLANPQFQATLAAAAGAAVQAALQRGWRIQTALIAEGVEAQLAKNNECLLADLRARGIL